MQTLWPSSAGTRLPEKQRHGAGTRRTAWQATPGTREERTREERLDHEESHKSWPPAAAAKRRGVRGPPRRSTVPKARKSCPGRATFPGEGGEGGPTGPLTTGGQRPRLPEKQRSERAPRWYTWSPRWYTWSPWSTWSPWCATGARHRRRQPSTRRCEAPWRSTVRQESRALAAPPSRGREARGADGTADYRGPARCPPGEQDNVDVGVPVLPRHPIERLVGSRL